MNPIDRLWVSVALLCVFWLGVLTCNTAKKNGGCDPGHTLGAFVVGLHLALVVTAGLSLAEILRLASQNLP